MRNRWSKHILILVSLVFVLAGCGGTSASTGSNGEKKETITLRIGSGHTPEGATWVRMVKDFYIPQVNKELEDTNYEIKWIESYGGTVAKLGEVLEAVESNLLDMGFIVTPFEPVNLKITNISYNTPFSSPDSSVISKVALDMLEKYPQFSEEYENMNQKLLAIGFGESYQLATNFPIKSFEDVKGKKIAAAGKNLEWIEPAGGVPIQGGLNEAYSGMQSGVMEGWILDSSMATGVKLYEQAKYFTQVGFGAVIIGGLTINKDKWDTLPKEVQDVLVNVGKQYPIEEQKQLLADADDNIKEMEDYGATVTALPEEERAKWQEMLLNLPNDYAKVLNDAGLPGTDIMRDYIEGQINAGYKFPVDYQID